MKAVIEQALANIFADNIALHPNTVKAETRKLDESITPAQVDSYMCDEYGWKSNFYEYYGQAPNTDVKE